MSEGKMIEGVTPLSSIQVLENGDVVQVSPRERLYSFIEAYVRKEGYPPTMREMVEGVEGINSTSVAMYHLRKLQRQGCIDYVERKARSITLIKPPGNRTAVRHCAYPGCTEPVYSGVGGLKMNLRLCEKHQRAEWLKAEAEAAERTSQTLAQEADDIQRLERRLKREVEAHAETKRLLKHTQEELEQLKARRADIRSKIQPPVFPVEDKRDGSEPML